MQFYHRPLFGKHGEYMGDDFLFFNPNSAIFVPRRIVGTESNRFGYGPRTVVVSL